MKFKDTYNFLDRRNEATGICLKYPNRVPVICEKSDNTSAPTIDKIKYMVPNDLTVGQFICVIRNRLKLNPGQAIFLFTNGIIPNTSACIYQIYDEHKDLDGFLYFTYSGENVFG